MMQWFKDGLCAGENWMDKPLSRFSDWNWTRTHTSATPQGCECCYKIRMVLFPFLYGLFLGSSFSISVLSGLGFFFCTAFFLTLTIGFRK